MTRVAILLRQCLKEWKSYLHKIDVVISEGLRLCLRGSLETMYNALHGEGTNPPSPLVLVHVELINNKVLFMFLIFLCGKVTFCY